MSVGLLLTIVLLVFIGALILRDILRERARRQARRKRGAIVEGGGSHLSNRERLG